jgi:quercetin dioxygenase-like cupin family protein
LTFDLRSNHSQRPNLILYDYSYPQEKRIMKKQFFVKLLIGFISVILLLPTAYNTWAETTSNVSSRQTQTQIVLPNDLQWKNNPDLAGVQSAIAVGDSSNSELYVLFGKMNKGALFPAHTHPDARITTVISGLMYYGVGEQFDLNNVKPYPAGSVIFTPAEVPHFMGIQDSETVVQETGFGPTGLKFMTNN